MKRAMAGGALLAFFSACAGAPVTPAARPTEARGESAGLSAIMKRLVDAVNADTQLRAQIEQLLQRRFSLGPPVDLDSMYAALDKTFEPANETFTDFAVFYRLLGPVLDDPIGKQVLASRAVQTWFHDFLRARKAYMDSPRSARLIPVLVSAVVDRDPMSDFAIPANGFQSFNDFFARKLAPGKRPIAQPESDAVMISPVDGNVLRFERASEKTAIPLKDGVRLDVEKLLAGSPYAARFKNGPVLLFQLAHSNYHRMHAPLAGKVIERRDAAGNYFATPVMPGMVMEQYRGHYILETARGLLAVVAVGANVVESVNLTAAVNQAVQKGEDLGHFMYGGSLIVVALERDPRRFDLELPVCVPTAPCMGGPSVRMGTALAHYE